MREISFDNLKNFLNKNNSSKNNQLVRSSVSKIIDDIKKNGDKAVLKYVKKFENKKATIDSLVIKSSTLKKAYESISKAQRQALILAYKRIHYYHSRQVKKNYKFTDKLDTTFFYSMEPY